MTANDQSGFPTSEHTPEAEVVVIPNVMTREEFQTRWDEIRKTYGTTKHTAGVRFEQTISELFAESGDRSWTQEQIATEVGYAQSAVSHLMMFGGFIRFISREINQDISALKTPLTLKRFRTVFWNQTKEFSGNDRKRYQKTWELILAAEQDEAAVAASGEPKKRVSRDFGPLREAVGKKFSDGKWHDAEAMANHLDTDEKELADALEMKVRLKEGYPYEVQEKPYGRSKRYRIFKTDRQLSRARILEELAPILDGLLVEGKKNGVTISVPAVARLGHQLKTLMGKWENE